MIGFCCLQVGHQVAEISTRIGFPAFCVAAKVAESNGLRSTAWAAKAVAATNSVAVNIDNNLVGMVRRSFMRNVSLPIIRWRWVRRYISLAQSLHRTITLR